MLIHFSRLKPTPTFIGGAFFAVIFGMQSTSWAYQIPEPRPIPPLVIGPDKPSAGPFRIGGGVSAPTPISQPEPQYSEEALKAHIEGEVQIQLTIDVTGHPINMKIIKKLGYGLDAAALRAVAQWTFKPGMKDGKAVPVIVTVAIPFRLRK